MSTVLGPPANPAAPGRVGRPRPRFVLAMATCGFLFNTAAWVAVGLLSPHISLWHDLGPVGKLLVVTLPVVIGSAGRVPVGALADRYGGGPVLAVVSLVSATSLVLFVLVDSPAALVWAACLLGVAGTGLAAGAALVIREAPAHRRGLFMSLFGMGIAGGALTSALAPWMVASGRGHALMLALAGLLTVFAVLVVLAPRGRPERTSGRLFRRDVIQLLRLPATRQISLLYALAFAPQAAIVLFLPSFLQTVYHDRWKVAVLTTAGFVAVAAVARPLGGWTSERADPGRVLVAYLGTAGGLGVIMSFQPRLPGGLVVLVGAAICLGMAGGVVLHMVGRTVPVRCAGLVVGTVGAAGGLAALLPPVLLFVVFRLDGSFAIGLMFLSGLLVIAAGYLHMRLRWVGGMVTFAGMRTAEPEEAGSTATTVVAVTAADTVVNGSALAALLADLAARHELAIVYAVGYQPPGSLHPTTFVAELRRRLNRQHVVAVVADSAPRADHADFALLSELLDDGAVVVAVVDVRDPLPMATVLAVRLEADQTTRVEPDGSGGVRLRAVPLEQLRAARG